MLKYQAKDSNSGIIGMYHESVALSTDVASNQPLERLQPEMGRLRWAESLGGAAYGEEEVLKPDAALLCARRIGHEEPDGVEDLTELPIMSGVLGFEFDDLSGQFFVNRNERPHANKCSHDGDVHLDSSLALKLGSKAEVARELAYRLYSLCERKKRANEALAYNGLVLSWPEILRIARQTPVAAQTGFFEEN